MIDISKQIAYWQQSAQEDWEVAQELASKNRFRHGLFFAHLTLEKILKSHICKRTNDLPPRNHNLIRLAEIAGINLQEDYKNILADLNVFNIEGRYPDSALPLPSQQEVKCYISKTREIFEWLMSLL